MPPKGACAKPKAKALALRRPAGFPLRRPAVAEAAVEETAEEKFKRGKAVVLDSVPIPVFTLGGRLVVTEGSYFGGVCRAAGRVKEVKLGKQGTQVSLAMTGTDNEEFLKHVTSLANKTVTGHLCPPAYGGEPHTPGLLHCQKGYMIRLVDEAKLTWEKNMESVNVDKLPELRAMQKAMKAKRPGGDVAKEEKDKKKKKARSLSFSSKKKKRKKGKKKKEK